MNISIKLDLNVNGATLVPTEKQFSKIKTAINQIIFKEEDNIQLRKKSIEKRGHYKWSDAEEQFMLKQHQTGYNVSDISKQMNVQFGTNRTKHSVQVRLSRINRRTSVYPNPKDYPFLERK